MTILNALKRCSKAAAAATLAASFGLSALAQTETTQAPEDFPIEGIAATVNDDLITYYDVRQRRQLLLVGAQIQPTEEIVRRITAQAREQLIEERLQLQRAAEFELQVSEDDVRASVVEMARSSGSDVETLYQQLLASGINPVTLEDQMRADIAWRRLMQGLYGRNIRISKNQIDDRLDIIRTGITQTRYELLEIFLFAPENEPELRARASELATGLYEQFQSGNVPFENAARQFSASATAATGGDMGWVSEAELEPEVREALAAMSGPGYSPPVFVESGIYLYAVRNKQAPQELKPQADVKQLIARNGDRSALDAAVSAGANCETLNSIADADDNLLAVDIGFVDPDELNDENRSRIEATATGAYSEPFETRTGLAMTFVCARETGGVQLPSREQVENELFAQQLARISERELRNLKRDAMIDRR